jgi:hypothetical protein
LNSVCNPVIIPAVTGNEAIFFSMFVSTSMWTTRR